MRLSLSEGIKVREKNSTVQGFGKAWNSGDIIDVAYPIYWENGVPEIITGQVWGQAVDGEELGIKNYFWVTKSPVENGQPTEPDVAYRFYSIARAIIEAQYYTAIKKAEQLGLPDNQLKAKLREIDKAFDYDADRGKCGKTPVVSPLKYFISTEVVAVPMIKDANDNIVPNRQKPVARYSQDLSKSKAISLMNILNDKQFEIKEGDKVLWVRYQFGSEQDRKLAGKVTPIGVVTSHRVEAVAPEYYEKSVLPHINNLPEDSEVMMAHNRAFQGMSEATLMQAISMYYLVNEEYLADYRESVTDEDIFEKLAPAIARLGFRVNNKEMASAVSEAKEAMAEVAASDEQKAPTFEELSFKQDIEQAKEVSGLSEDESAAFNELASFS